MALDPVPFLNLFDPPRPRVLWLYEQLVEALQSQAYDVTVMTPEMTASYLAVVLVDREYAEHTVQPNGSE